MVSCPEPTNIEIRKSGIFNSKRSLEFNEPPNANIATVPPSVQSKTLFNNTKASSKI